MAEHEEDQPFLDHLSLPSEYHRVSNSDVRQVTPGTSPTGKRRCSSLRSPLVVAVVTFFMTSVFWGFIFLNRRAICQDHASITYTQPKSTEAGTNFKTGAKFISCGNSINESKSLGCKYDILSNHYVPPQCVDEASVKIYQSDGSWFGYADESHTQLIESAEAMGSVEVYYTNMRDHIVHCAALWKKQFNAFFEERTYYDSLILDPKHTHHCADFLVAMTDKGPDFRKMPISVVVGHAGCWVRDKNCQG